MNSYYHPLSAEQLGLHVRFKEFVDGLGADDLKEMLRFANTAAYIVTTKKGAIRSMPERAQVEALLA